MIFCNIAIPIDTTDQFDFDMNVAHLPENYQIIHFTELSFEFLFFENLFEMIAFFNLKFK